MQRLKDEIARIERRSPTDPAPKETAAAPSEAIETVSRLRRSRRISITALDAELEKLKQEETHSPGVDWQCRSGGCKACRSASRSCRWCLAIGRARKTSTNRC